MSSRPEVILYIAASLDGYIGASDGGVEWLDSVQVEGEDYGYAEFFEGIDSLVMGRRTYDQALSFGPWPYAGKRTVVLSQTTDESELDEVEFSHDNPEAVLDALAEKGCRKTWLVGGSQVIELFRDRGLVSQYVLSLVPIILGAGIPLFTSTDHQEELELLSVESYPSGLVQLTYNTTPVLPEQSPEEE